MDFLFIILIISLLYYRPKQKNLIDDICTRADYLTKHTEEYAEKERETKFQNKVRHPWIVWESIGLLTTCCLVIYQLWGFNASLLFAVSPYTVSVTAWAMGMRLYLTACAMILITHYSLQSGIWSATAPLWAFTAFHSAVSPLFYPFYMMIVQPSVMSALLFIPWGMFVFGKRFRGGLRKRGESHKDMNYEGGKIRWNRWVIPVKLTGAYIYRFVFPSRLGFFNEDAGYLHNMRIDKYFWAFLSLNIVTLCFMCLVDYKMALWFFMALLTFGQFVVFGQFTAERYMTIANVAWCVILAKFLEQYPFIFTVIATLYFARSWLYVKAFRNNLVLFSSNAEAYTKCPEAHNNVALAWANSEPPNMHNAAAHWLIARNYGFSNANVLQNLAKAQIAIGQFEKARIHVLEAIKCKPEKKQEEHLNHILKFIDEKQEKERQNQKLMRRIYNNQ